MAGVRSYLLRRVLQAIPLIFSIIIFTFILIHLAPGDPTSLFLRGSSWGMPQEVIDAVKRRLGLDRSLADQLGLYLLSILKGDLGYSFFRGKPVLTIILEKIPATLLLVLPSSVTAIIVGTLIGAHSAKKRGSKVDTAITVISSGMYSVPPFWVGVFLIIIFSIQLKWLPTSGMISHGALSGSLLDILKHLILPSITLFIAYTPIFIRTARSSVLEVMNENFITTFKAVGLSENAVLYKHALKNALLPIITVAGMLFGFILTGAVLVETVFGWPGLGRTMYEAIFTRDYPLIMGIFIFTSIVAITLMIIVDVLYCVLDPRVTYE